MNLLKSLGDRFNRFFFPLEDGEELHISDGIWMYGLPALWIVVTLLVIF